MKPQELRHMSQKTCIIDIDGCRPIKASKIIWYKQPVFRNRLWTISKQLKGVKSPTERQIQAAGAELRSFVPTLDTQAWLADRQANKVAMAKPAAVKATMTDVTAGIDLDQLVMKLPEVPVGKMTEQQRTDYVDAFWSGLEPDDSTGETIDKETGEITKGVDLSVLDAA